MTSICNQISNNNKVLGFTGDAKKVTVGSLLSFSVVCLLTKPIPGLMLLGLGILIVPLFLLLAIGRQTDDKETQILRLLSLDFSLVFIFIGALIRLFGLTWISSGLSYAAAALAVISAIAVYFNKSPEKKDKEVPMTTFQQAVLTPIPEK